MTIIYHRSAWIAVALLLFVPLLGWAVTQGWTGQWDWIISDQLSLRGDDRTGFWAQFLQRISWIGDFETRSVIALLLTPLIYRWRGLIAAAVFFLIPLLASAYSLLFKMTFDRPRPDLITHLDSVSSASYPSGHATGAVVLYLIFAMAVPLAWRWPAALLAAIMIILTAISRLSLGVHWTTDIIGGTCVGLGFALLARPYLTTPIKPRGA